MTERPGSGRIPNLFVIGAAKSGTTSLHNYLNAHPDIFMSEPKEPQFFVDTPWFPKDRDWYLGLFEEAGDARYAGESSPFYTMRPRYDGVVEKMAAFCPEPPRLIYIMRDPIERIVSHFWHSIWQPGKKEWLSFEEAVETKPEYRPFSDYAMQLDPYIRTFGREHLYVLTFEELIQDPQAALTRIFAWLDVDTDVDIEIAAKRFNARPEVIEKPGGRALLYRLRHSAVWESVSPYVPQGLKTLGAKMSVESVRPEEVDFGPVVEKLRPEFQTKVRELEELLGRDFREWETVWDSGD